MTRGSNIAGSVMALGLEQDRRKHGEDGEQREAMHWHVLGGVRAEMHRHYAGARQTVGSPELLETAVTSDVSLSHSPKKSSSPRRPL